MHDDTVTFLCGLATGLALGTLGMFILDPKEGRRRRAQASDYVKGAAKDLRDRVAREDPDATRPL